MVCIPSFFESPLWYSWMETICPQRGHIFVITEVSVMNGYMGGFGFYSCSKED